MLGFHEEFAEVEGPYPEVLISGASDTESLINSDGIDVSIICAIGCFKLLSVVRDLIYHSMFASNIYSLECIVILGINSVYS